MTQTRAFGRYEVVAELGKGAMGVVYKAKDPMLDRLVAIKTIHMALDDAEDAEYESRFYQEAKAAGGLNHPNIITIYDIGKSENVVYMAMELLEGSELRKLMVAGGALPPAQAIDIAAGVAEGLAYAQDHDVVHRDIKPTNIMVLPNGRVKIMDFGIARVRVSDVRTQTGMVLGSPRYMSPEQALGKRADSRSDIFSLGVILYEMLVGKPPFTGADVNAIMFQTVNLKPPPPGALNAQVPEMLNFIVAKALAKNADERYAHAQEMVDDLKACRQHLATLPVAVAVTSPPPPPSIDPAAAISVVSGTFPGSRRSDAEPEQETVSATLGLSQSFDSLDATLRLAKQTDAVEDVEGFIKTLKLRALKSEGSEKRDMSASGASPADVIAPAVPTERHPPLEAQAQTPAEAPVEGWTPQQKLYFALATAAALVAGIIIVFR